MNLQEIFDRVLIRSGQYILPDAAIVLNVENGRFKTLVGLTLGTYNRYRPYSEIISKDLSSVRNYTFTESNTPEGVPEFIATVTPVRMAGVLPPFFNTIESNTSEYLDDRQTAPYTYRKPKLTVGIAGVYEIKAVYYHMLVNTGTAESPQWECLSLTDSDDLFFDLLMARFLISVGQYRRSFTIEELPIQTDAPTLVSDATSLETLTMTRLQENSRMALAWG